MIICTIHIGQAWLYIVIPNAPYKHKAFRWFNSSTNDYLRENILRWKAKGGLHFLDFCFPSLELKQELYKVFQLVFLIDSMEPFQQLSIFDNQQRLHIHWMLQCPNVVLCLLPRYLNAVSVVQEHLAGCLLAFLKIHKDNMPIILYFVSLSQ